jgi:outer membrane protein OmpA-like peptidoglycan-associated protein
MITSRILTVAFLLVPWFVPPAHAQGLGGFIKQRAKERVERKIAECIATDLACIEKAKAEGKEVTVKEAPAPAPGVAATTGTETSASSSLKPGEGAWVNYDFKPGDRPVFVEDFTKEEVGNFPRRLELKDGNMEVAEWKGGRYLRISSYPGTFMINLPEELPERFTMEFDATPGYNSNWTIIRFGDKAAHDVRFRTYGGKGNGGVFGGSHQANGMTPGPLGTAPYRGRIMADGRYVKVYINETRVANIPNAEIGRSKTISFEVPGHETEPVLLSNISIMAGGRKLYDALAESGRVATQGIYFDSGSDRIRPESTPTLKEIGEMLKEHADLKITIEGHTDNVGAAQSNRDLAQKRAAAVKAFLVSSYGIDAARLQATGFGDEKPVAPNTTPEGRQQNRRVELVKS